MRRFWRAVRVRKSGSASAIPGGASEVEAPVEGRVRVRDCKSVECMTWTYRLGCCALWETVCELVSNALKISTELIHGDDGRVEGFSRLAGLVNGLTDQQTAGIVHPTIYHISASFPYTLRASKSTGSHDDRGQSDAIT
jgi:hypothetical protein